VLCIIPVNAYASLEINYHATLPKISIIIWNNQPKRPH